MSQQTISRFFSIKKRQTEITENQKNEKENSVKNQNVLLENDSTLKSKPIISNGNIEGKKNDDTCKSNNKLIDYVQNEMGINSDQTDDSSLKPTASEFQPKSAKLKTFAYNKDIKLEHSDPNLKTEVKKRKLTDEIQMESSKKSKTLTDFEQQILDFKLNHMDKLLFIQSGYRYKLFGEDAIIASKLLNIKLTDGKISFDVKHPDKNDYLYSTFAQCSIPVERLIVHIRRLIVKGYKVGVVDQIETSAIRSETKSKSRIFERKIKNIYSAGTFIDDTDLERNVTGKSIVFINESLENYLSIVSINVYFSEIVYDQFNDDFTRINLESRFHHLEPIEIITIGEVSQYTQLCISNFIKSNDSNTSTINHKKLISSFKSYNEILHDFKDRENIGDPVFQFLSNTDINLLNVFNQSYDYLQEFNLTSIFNYLENFKNFSDIEKHIILDSNVLKSLEIFNNVTNDSNHGSLFHLIDHTYTKFGQRVLRNWLCRPLIDKSLITERQDAVESLISKMDSIPIERVTNVLKNCPDLELIFSRIIYGRSNRKEVYLFLKKITEILSVFKNLRNELISIDVLNSNLLCTFFIELKQISENDLIDMEKYLSMIYSPSAIDTKSPEHITTYFNEHFYNYQEIESQKDEILKVNELMDLELEELKKVTKNKDLQFTKVSNEPFLIQIRKSNIKNIPPDWIRINATLNCARYRSPQTNKLYKKLQYHEDVLKNVCNEQFQDFTKKISTNHSKITKLIRKIALFDALLSLANASINYNFNKPKIVDIPTIQIKNSRNPISEKLLKEKPTNSTYLQHTSSYIENDFSMQSSSKDNLRIALITGPNMGGKSSFMRQVGLTIVLAQIGCFIPCDKGSTLGVFENICIRLGSNDNIFNGKSTFQIELMECFKILERCSNNSKNSLILIDELGRGTSTVDGCSIAWSVLDYIVNEMSDKVLCLFVTHFKELEVFENLSNGIVKNFHLGYTIIKNNNNNTDSDNDSSNNSIDNDILFTYKLTPGYSAGSYGVYCAKIAGLPKEIIKQADKISSDEELKHIAGKVKKTINQMNNKNITNLYDMVDLM